MSITTTAPTTLSINDIVIKNNLQYRVSDFIPDFDMITNLPYRLAVLVDSSNNHVADVAENIILQYYTVNHTETMNIECIRVAVFYDELESEYMEFKVSSDKEINSIMNQYNSTGEYKLSFREIKNDYAYTGREV